MTDPPRAAIKCVMCANTITANLMSQFVRSHECRLRTFLLPHVFKRGTAESCVIMQCYSHASVAGGKKQKFHLMESHSEVHAATTKKEKTLELSVYVCE